MFVFFCSQLYLDYFECHQIFFLHCQKRALLDSHPVCRNALGVLIAGWVWRGLWRTSSPRAGNQLWSGSLCLINLVTTSAVSSSHVKIFRLQGGAQHHSGVSHCAKIALAVLNPAENCHRSLPFFQFPLPHIPNFSQWRGVSVCMLPQLQGGNVRNHLCCRARMIVLTCCLQGEDVSVDLLCYWVRVSVQSVLSCCVAGWGC